MQGLPPLLQRAGDAARRDEAEAELARTPFNIQAFINLGDVLRDLLEYDAAEDCYRQALAIAPVSRYLWVVLGVVVHARGRAAEASECFMNALELEPDALDAKLNLPDTLYELKQFTQAKSLYLDVLPFFPEHTSLTASIVMCDMNACYWSGLLSRDDLLSFLHDQMLPAHCALMLTDSPSEQMFFSRKDAQRKGLDQVIIHREVTRDKNEKIRVAYLSGDFHQHATAYLITELIEVHDRNRFDIVGISCGPDDGSATRKRLVKAFDQFIDVSDIDDDMAALWISALQIDILVDLKGYTRGTRSALLKLRPAPVVVNYLGYPGTMGTNAVDYILADRTVIPFSEQRYFSEKIVHLPDCYQANDQQIITLPFQPSRAAAGLPTEGFVFCCFNANQKITASMFACWMRLLKQVDGSVL